MSRFERFKRSQPSNTEIVEPEPTKPELIPPTGGEISRPVSGDAAALVSRPDDFQVYISCLIINHNFRVKLSLDIIC